MKDVTSTSFGLFIAFLLPGLEVLYTLTLWSESVATIFRTFLSSQSNVGLFLLVISAGVALGLITAVLRWLIFELWLCRGNTMRDSDFSQLAIEAKLLAFRAAVDEHYRYHQFYGGTVVVLPFFYAGLIYHSPARWPLYLILSPLFAAIEYGLYLAAVGPYRAFISRANFILKKEPIQLKERNDA